MAPKPIEKETGKNNNWTGLFFFLLNTHKGKKEKDVITYVFKG